MNQEYEIKRKVREDLSEKQMFKRIPLQRHEMEHHPTQVLLIPHHPLSLT